MFSFKIFSKISKKNAPKISLRGKLNLAVPTFPARLQTSILGAVDFTSVFGMGTGVSLQLYPPETFQNLRFVEFPINSERFKFVSCEKIFVDQGSSSIK